MVRKMVINNEEYVLDAPDDMPLLWVLRDILELTGTKFGCGKAQCGACTVLINDSPARSCVTPLSAVAHQEITTIEGFDQDDPMAQLRQAFHENHGLQCGFCTPGMVMSAVEMVTKNKNISEDEIRKGLEGNICRCTGYHNIVQSVKAGAAKMGG